MVTTIHEELLELIEEEGPIYFNDLLDQTDYEHNQLSNALRSLQAQGKIDAENVIREDNQVRYVKYYRTD